MDVGQDSALYNCPHLAPATNPCKSVHHSASERNLCNRTPALSPLKVSGCWLSRPVRNIFRVGSVIVSIRKTTVIVLARGKQRFDEVVCETCRGSFRIIRTQVEISPSIWDGVAPILSFSHSSSNDCFSHEVPISRPWNLDELSYSKNTWKMRTVHGGVVMKVFDHILAMTIAFGGLAVVEPRQALG